MRATFLLLPLTVVVGATGCYRYAEIPVADLRPGMSVRLQLSGTGVDRIRNGGSSDFRLLNGFEVSGTLSRAAADSLLLSVPTTVMEANVRQRTALQDLLLFRSEVGGARIRRFDRTRTTWTVVALGVAAAVSVTVALQRGGRAGGTIPPPPPPPETRIPLLIRWQLP